MGLSLQLNKSTPSNFKLVFPLLPAETKISAVEELVLNIHGSILPGVQLDMMDRNWQASKGRIAGGPIQFEDFTVEFIVDSEFTNWKILFNWMSLINNNKDKMMANYKDYTVDASIQILDNFNSEILRIGLVGIWPMNIGAVSLSNREGEQVLECNANFAYDYFEIK